MTETMTEPMSSIPTSYAITTRPAHQRAGTPLPARFVADMEATMRSGQALAFSTEGLSPLQTARLAARLNAIGRRAGRDFAVRTRRADNQLFAWAVSRLPGTGTRRRKNTGTGEANMTQSAIE